MLLHILKQFVRAAKRSRTALRAPVIADATVTIFDNSNIVESYPGLVSPLTYSFAQYAYARVYRAFLGVCGVDQEVIRAQRATLENMLGRVDGRVYYNLVNWYRAAGAAARLPAQPRAHGDHDGRGRAAAARHRRCDRHRRRPSGLARLREWARMARMASR